MKELFIWEFIKTNKATLTLMFRDGEWHAHYSDGKGLEFRSDGSTPMKALVALSGFAGCLARPKG